MKALATDRYLTEFELAQRLGISPRTLQKMRQDGTGPPYVKIGEARTSPVRYPESRLGVWEKSRMRTSTSDAVAAR
jgi:predicted DNA-binding transcriptional regulator AlpA